MFFAPQKPKTTVFTLVAKITVFIVFFVPVPNKNTGIYAVFHHVARCSFYIREGQKTQYFTMFLLPERSRRSSNNCSKTVQNRLPKASSNFSLKNVKT